MWLMRKYVLFLLRAGKQQKSYWLIDWIWVWIFLSLSLICLEITFWRIWFLLLSLGFYTILLFCLTQIKFFLFFPTEYPSQILLLWRGFPKYLFHATKEISRDQFISTRLIGFFIIQFEENYFYNLIITSQPYYSHDKKFLWPHLSIYFFSIGYPIKLIDNHKVR